MSNGKYILGPTFLVVQSSIIFNRWKGSNSFNLATKLASLRSSSICVWQPNDFPVEKLHRGLEVHHLCLNMMLVLDWIQFSRCNHYQLLFIQHAFCCTQRVYREVGLSTQNNSCQKWPMRNYAKW